VAFICNDKVKGLDGDGRVVFYGRNIIIDILKSLNRFFLINFLKILPPEHGVKTLDGTDADAGSFIQIF